MNTSRLGYFPPPIIRPTACRPPSRPPIHRCLRPGGIYLLQDISASSRLEENLAHPMGPFVYTISCMHCMTVSLAYDGEGLGAAWGEQVARERLARAGFVDVQLASVRDDRANHYYVARRP